MYRHFPSKDDLIVAYLERTNEQLLEWMEGLIASHRSPRAALEAIFDGSRSSRRAPECLGCTFVAAGEFPEPDHLGHKAAAAPSERSWIVSVSWPNEQERGTRTRLPRSCC